MPIRKTLAVTALISICALLPGTCSFAAAQQRDSVTFYVSPDGNDDAKGTQKRPWRTLEGAAQQVNAFMQKHPEKDVTLLFAGGRYQVRKKAVFEGLSSHLTLAAAGDGEPVISGMKPVTGWTAVTDAGVLPRIPVSARDKVLQADLNACGIKELGMAISRDNRIDLYHDGRRQTLARWPDSGFANAGKAVGKTDLEDTWIHVHGTEEGIIEYCDDRVAAWADEKDPCMFGYWYWDWAEDYQKIASVDAASKTVTLTEPWHGYGYRDGLRYYGLNLLCELDSPGEYYIDRESGVIYWFAPEGFDPNDPHTAVSVYRGDFMIRMKDCDKGVTIKGLTFEGGRRGAVTVEDGQDVCILDCRFARFGETAIRVNGGWRHKVQGCLLEELGCGGIWMKGGDRKNLIPCDFVVDNTIVDNFSLYKRTYEPAVYFGGIGAVISHDLFQNSPSSALRLDGNDIIIEYCQCFDLIKESDDQGGSDSWFNYTYRRMLFRYNHWKNIRGGMFAGAGGIRFDDIISGQIVFGNVFECVGGGGFGGVNINGGRDNVISNNIFYDCPTAVTGYTANGKDWRKQMEMNKEQINEVNGLGPLYEMRYPEIKSSFYEKEGHNYVHNNIVVNADQVVNSPLQNLCKHNTEVKDDTKGLGYYLQPSVQRKAGLSPIPFDEIGVKDNRFLNSR